MAYQPRSSTHTRLVKQTYSVFVETNRGQRKWHMSAPFVFITYYITNRRSIAVYFIPATVDRLRTVDDIPGLTQIRVPLGMYTSAKMAQPFHSPIQQLKNSLWTEQRYRMVPAAHFLYSWQCLTLECSTIRCRPVLGWLTANLWES